MANRRHICGVLGLRLIASPAKRLNPETELPGLQTGVKVIGRDYEPPKLVPTRLELLLAQVGQVRDNMNLPMAANMMMEGMFVLLSGCWVR